MLELVRQLSDDQMAVLGCFGALGAAMGLLSISFHANPQNKNSAKGEGRTEQSLQPVRGEQEPRRAA